MSGPISISVITPSYNQGKFIELTIHSVLGQNIDSLEYMVVDGGSQDETLSILRRYGDRISWVSEPDHGQAHAVNKGIAATNGEIIAWINSDDIYYRGTLAQVVEFFFSHPNVDVLYGDAHHIDVNSAQLVPYDTEPWDANRLKERCFLCQPAVFFRRRVVEKFGGLDESLYYCMDYEYWLRLAFAGVEFAYLPVVLAGSRMYPENKTLSNRTAVHEEIINMLAKKFDKIPPAWLFRYVHLEVLERYGWERRDDQARRGAWLYQWLLLRNLFLAFLRWRRHLSADFYSMVLAEIRSKIGLALKPVQGEKDAHGSN